MTDTQNFQGGAQFDITSPEAAQDAMRYAREAKAQARNAGPHRQTTAMVAERAEVTFNGGHMTSGSQQKTREAVTYAAPRQGRPGFIQMPNGDETPIDAAKAAGLIPQHWQEGDPSPFDVPAEGKPSAGKADAKAAAKEAPKGSEELSATQHTVKAASDILAKADGTLGTGAVDELLAQAADLGDVPLDAIPEGFTEAQARQVYAGYVAQAEEALAPVNASVATLEETLTDAELLQARMATLTNSSDELAALGQMAVSRLAQLPQTDPEGFREMVEAMTPAERKHIRYDDHRGEWLVDVPGFGLMSYGAAVQGGWVRV